MASPEAETKRKDTQKPSNSWVLKCGNCRNIADFQELCRNDALIVRNCGNSFVEQRVPAIKKSFCTRMRDGGSLCMSRWRVEARVSKSPQWAQPKVGPHFWWV